MLKLTTRGPEVAQAIADRQDFTTHGALRGNAWPGSLGTGYLPREWHHSFRRATYAVWSYDTPIAWWREDDGWTIPPVKYSRRTTLHQGRLYLAARSVNREE
jgi:hypothetical protein